ncbi:ribosomal RNA processing protein 1 homolog B-like [Scomber scombrus]|uniref:ribosomal RNA processing protein 1 homolog B-like n=1 Tax=Scomber scombrus TaxID=13677 RepID=UPI002DDAAA53|nr:ribosomal RNA processing protein 1 homolog B-like [Scomber scombrus]
MAALQEAEVQLAQRLASNEKPIRSKAMKKLRKYINVRSQKAAGGFTGDELLKLWKGLFYCLWMQDKPLLQEELSKVISSLMHSFQGIDAQLLFLESFLQTLKREWTGIDRLRMDKFFQLVRFMFRQTFEMLKRKDWDSSLVGRFLEVLTAQLLQSDSAAPSGLQLHVLDLYMTELAALGSAELTADQNLTFIEPFCKTAAKTKDRTLFRAICSNIFTTIIDQAPYAIQDLMKELQAAGGSDSGQASEEEEEEEEQPKEKKTSEPVDKKGSGKQMNGRKSHKNDDDDDFDDDDDDDDLLHLEESDSELPDDEDMGPVLQFDYSALADKLFGLASRNSTPSLNRQRLYKIIKTLRDLSEGVFPQDEYPDEVSTDEDDDMFGSRKRMKRGGRHTGEEDDDGAPAAKKKKGKKKEASSLSQSKDGSETADMTSNDDDKKKKKRKKKKKKKVAAAGQAEGAAGEEKCEAKEGSETQNSVSSVKVTEAATPEGESETLLLVEVKKQPAVTVTDEDQPEVAEEQQTDVIQAVEATAETEVSSEADGAASGKKDEEEEGLKAETDAESQVNPEEEITPETEATTPAKKKKKKKKDEEEGLKAETEAESQVSPEEEITPETEATTPAKKKKKKKKDEEEELKAETEAESQVSPEEEITPETEATTPAKKKKKGQKKMEEAEVGSQVSPEVEEEEASQETAATPLKKKTKKKQAITQEEEVDQKPDDMTVESSAAAEQSAATPLKKKRKKNQKESTETPEVTQSTPAKKKKKSRTPAAAVEEVGGGDEEETKAVASSATPAKKKKKKIIPVTFEYEDDEVEAAINGLAEEEAGVEELSTPLTSKKTKKKARTPSGSDFVTFQSKAAVPKPLFCKTKRSPGTPSAKKKKSQTPKSESKKVTFGLKNNKTAEFRKNDRSLLVSPDGSSRVPFDPQQKPKCGVLKSPPTLRSSSVKKTPNKKKSLTTPKSTPKRRMTAADFF